MEMTGPVPGPTVYTEKLREPSNPAVEGSSIHYPSLPKTEILINDTQKGNFLP